jgi:hypothetical protein
VIYVMCCRKEVDVDAGKEKEGRRMEVPVIGGSVAVEVKDGRLVKEGRIVKKNDKIHSLISSFFLVGRRMMSRRKEKKGRMICKEGEHRKQQGLPPG